MICKNCGKQNEDCAKFCLNCGNNLEEQLPVIFCANCFGVVDENGKFCEKCGAPVMGDFTEEKMLESKSNVAKEAIYQKAIRIYDNAATTSHFSESIELLKKIPGYKDVDDLIIKYTMSLQSLSEKERGKRVSRMKIIIPLSVITLILISLLVIWGQQRTKETIALREQYIDKVTEIAYDIFWVDYMDISDSMGTSYEIDLTLSELHDYNRGRFDEDVNDFCYALDHIEADKRVRATEIDFTITSPITELHGDIYYTTIQLANMKYSDTGINTTDY